MIFVLFVTLLSSRVALEQLGVSDFGLYGLIAGVVSMIGFFNSAIASSFQRFMSISLAKNDKAEFKLIISSSISISIVIGIFVLLIGEVIGLIYLKNYMVYPIDRYDTIQVVFHISLFTFFISILQAPYHALLISQEKMKVYAYIGVLEVILKFLSAYLLFLHSSEKLIFYSIYILFVTLIVYFICIIVCKKQFSSTSFRINFNLEYFIKIFTFSGWNLIGNFSAVARNQGINMLLNIFFGTLVNASFVVNMQVHNAVQTFAYNLQIAFNPEIIKQYGRRNLYKMQNLVFTNSKLSFSVILLLSTPTFLNLEYILGVWLSDVPPYTEEFIKLSLIFLLIDSISYPLIIAVQASGIVKWYQIIVGIFISLSLPISYVVLKFFNGTPASVFYVVIGITFATLFIRLLFVNKLLNFKLWDYYKSVLIPSACMCLSVFTMIYFVSLLWKCIFEINTLFQFILSSAIYMCMVLFCFIAIGLSPLERDFLKRKIIRIKG
jgi:O-antigen/teichoic acid export membrane protein